MPKPSDCDPASPALAQEARLLVALLRSSRLALLFGEAGSDKSAFLQSSLLPLLQRRAEDQAPPALAPVGETTVVVPVPDRRQRRGAARVQREVVLLLNDWSGAPLQALRSGLRLAAQPGETVHPAVPERLTDCLHTLGTRFGIHFIVLLDRFEEFLRLPPQRDGITEFTEELIEALNAPQLPASFLLSLNEGARPALTALRRRVPGFDDFSLKLTGVAAIKPPVSTSPPIKPPTPLRTPIKTQDVYTLIEATLNRTESDNDCEPFQGSVPGALAPAVVKPPPLAAAHRAEAALKSTWPDEVAAEAIGQQPTSAVTSPRRRRRPPPTLIGRCMALLSRLWRPRRKPD